MGIRDMTTCEYVTIRIQILNSNRDGSVKEGQGWREHGIDTIVLMVKKKIKNK